jgi:hypothetical protein
MTDVSHRKRRKGRLLTRESALPVRPALNDDGTVAPAPVDLFKSSKRRACKPSVKFAAAAAATESESKEERPCKTMKLADGEDAASAASKNGRNEHKNSSLSSAQQMRGRDAVDWLRHDLEAFLQFKALSDLARTRNFCYANKHAGTLTNGLVYIALSPLGGLGIFAGKEFARGDVVTEYGGGIRAAHYLRSLGSAAKTHARFIPDSLFVRDGKGWAALFECGQLDQAAERKRAASQRTRVLPNDVDTELSGLGA